MAPTVKIVRITTAPISLQMLITGQASFMSEKGLEVHLVSAPGAEWQHVETGNDIYHHVVPMARQISIWQDVQSLWQLYQLLKKIQPQIVHSHTPKAGLLGMIAAKLARVPVRLHTLAGLPLQTTTGIKRRILTWAEELTYAFAQEVWVNSLQLKSFILAQKMIRPSKAFMILGGSSNGINLSQFNPATLAPKRLAEIAQQHGFIPTDFIFLAVGRVVKDKGIVELLAAFKHIHTQFPHTKLCILGPLEQHLDPLPADAITTLTTHPAIVHVHWSNEVAYYMQLAHCLVHASHREGFPNVLLQAGAMNLPIICSEISGNTDIVTQENEGFIYPVKNTKVLQQQMVTVLTQPTLAAAKAATLQQKVIHQFERSSFHTAIFDRYQFHLSQKNIHVR
ncbi:MAG: glycosyltransferase family 1 protein [Bacteroidetes bacterium]|nr:MAG: glycosyltransferase family 1 protein [Bacteroidota bacterium]TAF93375.1 MAG: glycosyltransferase family 1 protein [Bacteroidota bacterium]